jgi:hypothetical protein
MLRSSVHLQHGHPLVTAGAAQATAINEPLSQYFSLEADRRMSLAAWAKPVAGVIVISTALKRGRQGQLISRAISTGQEV